MSFTLLAAIPLFGMPGAMEWLIIAGVFVLLFGAAKLPKLGKGLGEGIRNFKTSIKGETDGKSLEKSNGETDDSKDE